MESELKLCPFCGSSGIIRHDMRTGNYGACCVKCYGEVRCIYKEIDDARIAWNRRYPDELDDLRKMPEPIPAPPEAPRRWRCGLGHECDEGWVRCPKCSLPVREVVEDTGSGGET